MGQADWAAAAHHLYYRTDGGMAWTSTHDRRELKSARTQNLGV
jgi:hypothetical protein